MYSVDGVSGVCSPLKKTTLTTKTMQKQADNYNTQVHCDKELILKNLSAFNTKFGTDYKYQVSDDEVIKFFYESYLELFEENMTLNVDYKKLFNQKFHPYAAVE